MANAHRTNVLVTSCLKTPVDPQTKAPLALYERERVLPYTADLMNNRDFEKDMEYEDSDSEYGDGDDPGKGNTPMIKDYRVMGDHVNLSEIFFSNEEYYSKLEELKNAHLCTMAELESMYRKKLQLKCMAPLDTTVETRHRLPMVKNSSAATGYLRKCQSALELRRAFGDTSDEENVADNDVGKGLLSSPKEHIKNMWQDFKLYPHYCHPSSSSLQSLPGDKKSPKHPKGKSKKKQGLKDVERETWKHRMTVPKPFQMTLREAEVRRRGIKTRSEIERENAELRRQLEELTECQRKFRASPVPAHVRLPLYEELQERDEERRRTMREREEQHLSTIQKPFSFLERERLKREQRDGQLRLLQPSIQEKVKPFKAKPVPKAVYAAASGEQMREEQLYRSIKMQMRAKEMFYSAAMPPSMLARRLNERKKTKDAATAAEGDSGLTYRPKINKEVPDFDSSYRRFQRNLENRKELRPVTACEPFQLRTSQISSHRQRILADLKKEQTSPGVARWPYVSPGADRTPNSSLCSSLSGSLELLPAKITDATKKRQEAVRKVLDQRKKAEEEEERWRERQKQREKKLQRVVLKRAQANDPHLALSQTCQSKLKQFRKQDLQRRREYQQEIKEIQERVMERPLLLEQVAQRNAKQAAEKRYADALRGCGLTEAFISGNVTKCRRPGRPGSADEVSLSSDSKRSDKEETDMGYAPVHYRKVYLDDEDLEANLEEREAQEEEYKPNKEVKGDRHPLSRHKGEDIRHYSDDDGHSDNNRYSDDSYHYSDDHENDSDNSEHDLGLEEKEQDGDLITRRHGSDSDRSSQHSRAKLNSDEEN
ncbi:protein FAM161A [Polymixia lowei]